eukprot:scaffold340_cov256-Pinguiococcus_pyrenoidosus.AAC.19
MDEPVAERRTAATHAFDFEQEGCVPHLPTCLCGTSIPNLTSLHAWLGCLHSFGPEHELPKPRLQQLMYHEMRYFRDEEGERRRPLSTQRIPPF